MIITLIGAGRLAKQTGKALRAAGHQIAQVFSRTIESANTLAQLLDSQPTCSITDIRGGADIYLLALKDSVLEEIAEQLGNHLDNPLLVHTAGSMPLQLFQGKTSRYGVFYPMQTFSKERDVNFREIHCFIEANDEQTLRTIREMAASISDNVQPLASSERRQLHLAAVFACNFANHCYALADQLLSESGVGFSAMLPLIDETARKVHQLSPVEAQTGPAVRYDENVIMAQSKMLHGLPKEIYQLMSRSIHELNGEGDSFRKLTR